MNTIRIMLVDDHEMVRQGIKSLLTKHTDIKVVAEANNGQSALDMAGENDFDIAIMDISMPVLDGLATTQLLAQNHPEISVLALTVHDDKLHFFKMFLEMNYKRF